MGVGEHNYTVIERKPHGESDIILAAFPREMVVYVGRQDALKKEEE